ncbi:hypothetical protein [Actinophytocola glycyrrhizae]|uniref:DUF1634 domain-containing protein n=1 Tax=Actinophytocola glycyrrhizae TaxID=2044873 RepID=A0ABV9S7I5_9PSEU
MTDEDKTGSYESEEAATGPLVLAAIGSVLLVAVGVLTLVVGLLSPLITDGCGGESDYGAGGVDGPAYWRNAQVVERMLTVPVLLVLPVGLLLTWLRFVPPYRPRAWVPIVGLLVIGALWLVANSLLEGRLF